MIIMMLNQDNATDDNRDVQHVPELCSLPWELLYNDDNDKHNDDYDDRDNDDNDDNDDNQDVQHVPELCSLPWELLYQEVHQCVLAFYCDMCTDMDNKS